MAEVRDSGARITFVGLGRPRQEVFAFEAREGLDADARRRRGVQLPQRAVAAGPADDAALGLEWLYRLVQELRRLWRRYVFLNPAYVTLLAAQKLGMRRFESESLQPPENSVLYG